MHAGGGQVYRHSAEHNLCSSAGCGRNVGWQPRCERHQVVIKIKIELAQALGFESVHLQLNGDQAVQTSVKKQQVEREVTTADLHREFRADEAEIPTQLDQKRAQLRQQPRCRSASV
jgi:hypothetical protein